MNFTPRFRHFGSLAFWTFQDPYPFMYPAPVAVLYRLFFRIPVHPLLAFLLTGLAGFVAAGLLFGRLLRRRGVRAADAYLFPFAVMLSAYPFWFAAKQANMEILIWVAVTAGLVLFLAGRGYSAAVCFGIATSLKIYPFVYFGLLLARRQYRQIALGLATAVTVTLASLRVVYPDVRTSWRMTNAGVDHFRTMYMLHRRPEIGADHSLFALFKTVVDPLPPAHLLSVYLAVAAVSGVVLYFVRIRRLPVWNQILCLTLASILLPPTSFEYTLLHLFVPFAMYTLLLVGYERVGRAAPHVYFVLACFFLLFGFLAEIIFNDIIYAGQVKSVVLLALFGFALAVPIEAPPGRLEGLR